MIILSMLLISVLVLGCLLVIYVTRTRNNWGINLHVVSCPCCNAPLPGLRKPRSMREWMWGGWICPACGASVDKWGREITDVVPSIADRSESGMRRVFRRRLIFIAPIAFSSLMLLDWIGIIGGGFPSSWIQTLAQIFANLVWTALFTTINYFVMIRSLMPPQAGADQNAAEHASNRREGIDLGPDVHH